MCAVGWWLIGRVRDGLELDFLDETVIDREFLWGTDMELLRLDFSLTT